MCEPECLSRKLYIQRGKLGYMNVNYVQARQRLASLSLVPKPSGEFYYQHMSFILSNNL